MNLGTKFVNRAGVRVNTTTNWGSVITIISKLSAQKGENDCINDKFGNFRLYLSAELQPELKMLQRTTNLGNIF